MTKKVIVWAAVFGIGILLWWLFFRSGINRTILIAGTLFVVALITPYVNLPIKDSLAWGIGIGVGILVSLLLAPRFGVPPLIAVGFAVFCFAAVLWVMNIETTPQTEEDAEEVRKFWEEWEESRQADEDIRNMGRIGNDD